MRQPCTCPRNCGLTVDPGTDCTTDPLHIKRRESGIIQAFWYAINVFPSRRGLLDCPWQHHFGVDRAFARTGQHHNYCEERGRAFPMSVVEFLNRCAIGVARDFPAAITEALS